MEIHIHSTHVTTRRAEAAVLLVTGVLMTAAFVWWSIVPAPGVEHSTATVAFTEATGFAMMGALWYLHRDLGTRAMDPERTTGYMPRLHAINIGLPLGLLATDIWDYYHAPVDAHFNALATVWFVGAVALITVDAIYRKRLNR